jgi:hypothetical protein
MPNAGEALRTENPSIYEAIRPDAGLRSTDEQPRGQSRLLHADGGQLAAKERFLHQPTAAIEVLFHAATSRIRIATRDRVDDEQVSLGRALLERTEVHAKGHEAIDFREASIDQLHRKRIARRGGNREVKADVGRFGDAVVCRWFGAVARRIVR